jgi:3-hydroxyacyl-CoA dehydrogenase/enoyl-CoA hydratase/3-hydroxybutyryl-CoA epimerase
MTVSDSRAGVHWRHRVDADRICRLTLDKQSSSGNSLSRDVLDELDESLEEISATDGLRGLIIESGKESGFIPGADINEFDSIDSAERGAALAAKGQSILAKLAALPIPTVAAINGYALGGGLELALACDYRVALESYDRNLGLPEVQLGIHPGFGGTVRAVQLLGAPRALDLMLTGRQLSPVEAHAIGLVDRLASAHDLVRASKSILQESPPSRRASLALRILNLQPLRTLMARRIRSRVARKAPREHYPAPYAIIDLWAKFGARGEAAYRAEAASIGRLFLTPTARNLVRVYKLRERLKRLAPKSAAVQHVHVVGAGVMGGDIAAWCALRGLNVSLQDQVPAAVDAALGRAADLFGRRLRAPGAADAAKRRLRADALGESTPSADIVIEAIVERLEVKREIFADLEARATANAILSSNTSSLRIEDIARGLSQPQRLVGLHFFNPVAKMPLVEVVRGELTDDEVFSHTMAFVAQIGKLPLPCKSAPGFVVNRILMPYLIEALRAHEDGRTLEEIDATALAFGMPVGPIELADQVGLDIALHVAEILAKALGGEIPELLASTVEKGNLGVKTGQGFYRYAGRKPQKRPFAGPIDAKLQDRLILPLLNESVACVSEGIVDDADLLDAGAVFGTGFAPFRGGPLRYAEERGVDDILARLDALTQELGERFAPHPGWAEHRGKRD